MRWMMLAVIALWGAAVPAASPTTGAVAAAVEHLHQAMVARDGAALRDLTDEGLTYGHSTGATEDKANFVANLLAGKSPYATIAFPDPTITVRGDAAWVRGVMRAQMRNAAGGTDPIEFKILYIFVKRGHWELLARQAVK